MALLGRLPSSTLPIQSRNPSPLQRQVFTINCSLSSQNVSPFTEKHSVERYQRDGQLPQPSCSCQLPSDEEFVRFYNIAMQLKKLLEVLREKMRDENGGERKGHGNVFLVGTGPGDPELLTNKAMRVIESADLLLYDRLVSNDVLNFFCIYWEDCWMP